MSQEMNEHQPVHTTPGEPKAPEVYEGATVVPEPGAHAQHDDINVPQIAVIAIAASLFLYILIVFLEAFYYDASRAEEAMKQLGPSAAQQALITEQRDVQLGTYHWVDQSKGVRGIPIDRAMALVVRQYEAAQGQNEGNGHEGKQQGAKASQTKLDHEAVASH